MGTNDFLCHCQEQFLGQELVWKEDSVTLRPRSDKATRTEASDRELRSSDRELSRELRYASEQESQSRDGASPDWEGL